MKVFEIYTPTRILFGAEFLNRFAEETAKLGKKVLLVTGQGAVKRLGYLDVVVGALKEQGLAVQVFEGIEPNPQADTCDRAAEIGRAFGAEVVCAVGGGSSMDAAKAISALLHTGERSVWPFVLGQPKAGTLPGALPIVAVPTTAATASEVTPYAVISNKRDNEKSVLAYEFFKPRVAWLNPAFTAEVPERTTQDGAADILSHVLENYLLGGEDSPIADMYSEMVIRTVVETLPLTLKDSKNLSLRGRLLWASTLALNGYQLAGRNPAEFVLHSLEHSLSGFNTELAHGRGLATLYPTYLRWLLKRGRAVDRIARLGRNVFGVTESGVGPAAELSLLRFEEWLRGNGLYQRLSDVGISTTQFRPIAEYCVRIYGNNGQLNALGPVTIEDIVEIFQGAEEQSVTPPYTPLIM